MSERLKIGDSDLVTVAVDATLGLLTGIVDGAEIPVLLGQIYPQDARDLPVILGHSPGEDRTPVGRRELETINADIEITVIYRLPDSHLNDLAVKIGRVVAEIEKRLAAAKAVYVDGSLVASDLQIRRIDRGFTGGSGAVAAARIELGCTIHHIAGVHDTVVATRPNRGSL